MLPKHTTSGRRRVNAWMNSFHAGKNRSRRRRNPQKLMPSALLAPQQARHSRSARCQNRQYLGVSYAFANNVRQFFFTPYFKSSSPRMRSLRTVTVGCKVNQYETEFVREGLLSAGSRDAAEQESAACFILMDDKQQVFHTRRRRAMDIGMS
jgi:hypothetical protein